MQQVTYLIGAGASANCVPTVDKIPQILAVVIDALQENLLEGKYVDIEERSKQDLQRLMIKDLTWLFTESSRHASIDTFAKKLWLKEEWDQLRKLKFTSSVFFTCV